MLARSRLSSLMSHFQVASLFLVFAMAAVGQATPEHSADDWVRIESKWKEFSVGLPEADYLVNNENGGIALWYEASGRSFSVSIIADKSLKSHLEKQARETSGTNSSIKFFKVGDFVGEWNEEANAMNSSRFYWFDFASSHAFYRVSATVLAGEVPSAERLFRSIKLDNKSFLMSSVNDPPEKRTVSVSDLKTSESIIRALNQADPVDLKLEKAPNLAGSVDADHRFYTRPLIILRQPRAEYAEPFSRHFVTGTVQLLVTFLANGTIGSIAVSKSLDKILDQQAFNAAKQIKFVPAKIDCKAVDVARIISFNFY